MGINFSFPSSRFGNWGIKLDITFTIYCFKSFVGCFIMSISNDMSPLKIINQVPFNKFHPLPIIHFQTVSTPNPLDNLISIREKLKPLGRAICLVTPGSTLFWSGPFFDNWKSTEPRERFTFFNPLLLGKFFAHSSQLCHPSFLIWGTAQRRRRWRINFVLWAKHFAWKAKVNLTFFSIHE